MAASDRHDRIRIMILDERPNGYPDPSAVQLRRIAASAVGTPYELRDEQVIPQSCEGVRGVCWIVLPARHKKHWLTIAEELRSQWVQAEAIARRYEFDQPDGERRSGVSLDLAMLEKYI
jgi:hypothetical protein